MKKRIFKPLIVAEIQINICVYIYKFNFDYISK